MSIPLVHQGYWNVRDESFSGRVQLMEGAATYEIKLASKVLLWCLLLAFALLIFCTQEPL